jgi:dolichyl-diphosphooligosaccharide--protein glycosyltransferase
MTLDDKFQQIISFIERVRSRSSLVEALFVGLVVVFMFWLRLRPYDRFITADGRVIHSGTDAWYHRRMVEYTFRNFPKRMQFDPWTGFPVGRPPVGQFGSLYDQLLAAAAHGLTPFLPLQTALDVVFLAAPPVIGTAIVVPVYLIIRRLDGPIIAASTIVLLAFIPGTFLTRSFVGTIDHNIAEPLLFYTVLLGAVTALSRASAAEGLPSASLLELLQNRRLFWPALGTGVAATLYTWVWPPGIIVLGLCILGIYVTSWAYYQNPKTRTAVLTIATISFGSQALLATLRIDVWTFTAVQLSALHILVPSVAAVGFAVTAVSASVVYERGYTHPAAYIVQTGLFVSTATGLLALVSPVMFERLLVTFQQTFDRFNPQTATIAEAQPLITPSLGITPAVLQYGGLVLPIVVGFIVLVVLTIRTPRAENIFTTVIVFCFFILAIIQLRFNLYFAVFAAYLSVQTFRAMVSLTETPASLKDIELTHVATLLLIAMLVIPGLVYPVQSTVIGVSDRAGPGEYVLWEPTLEWLSTETPSVEGAGIEKYAAYERDGYVYPDSAYGVLSWWDYGHWITVTGERIPVTNPFQQHAPYAADALLATNDSKGTSTSTKWLNHSDGFRYVIVDWRMVNTQSKMQSIAVFNEEVDATDLSTPTYISTETGYERGPVLLSDRYYQSFAVRLYQFHGSAITQKPYVVHTEPTTIETADGQKSVELVPTENAFVREFESIEAAEAYVKNTSNTQLGGIGHLVPEPVEALKNYRLVHASPDPAERYPPFVDSLEQDAALTGLDESQLTITPAWVKVFERVPGATIAGTAPPGSTVEATVELSVNHYDGSFNYTQYATTDETGAFFLTLPYATKGHDSVGPETGHTNTSVRATGPYTLSTESPDGFVKTTTLNVSESAVVTGSELNVSLLRKNP